MMRDFRENVMITENQSEKWLKIMLWLFGGPAAFAIFPFVMPRRWMAVVHQWLGMGVLPDKPIVEYLARSTSAFCAFYGFLLLFLASDVRRYSRVITFQAVAMIILPGAGAFFGLRAGMPLWWMLGDAASCWLCCGTMLVLQRQIAETQRSSS